MKSSRRNFLKITGLITIGTPLISSAKGIPMGSSREISKKEKAIAQPSQVKSSLILNVRDYGATGDGTTRDTAALQLTIDRCHVLGGGDVLIPAGNYLTGALQLRSHVTLHLEKDTILTGSPAFDDYPVMQVRWEGKWTQGHTALIYAVDAENTGIKGPGKIAGSHALGGRPNKDNPLRHPTLIEFIGCRNITLEDFSTDYYLMWSIHPTSCENITIRNLTIRSTGGNGDGIDVDSCKHVVIEGCDIATGDDCISLKSGRGMEAYTLLQTTEDVRIRNCKFSDSIFACIGIGSESSGGIRDAVIENCTFVDTSKYAIYIKSRVGRGAFIEDLTFRNLDVSGIKEGFLRINQVGSGIQDQNPVAGSEGIPSFKNLRFSDIKVTNVETLVEATWNHPEKPLDVLELINIKGDCKKGILLANAKNVKLKDIAVTGFEGPLLTIQNVTGEGLKDAVTTTFPVKIPETVASPDQLFRLK